MKVFKFGGASVKDAQAIKNLTAILSDYRGLELIIVISAMGKTTNKLEEIIKSHNSEDGRHDQLIDSLKKEHQSVIEELALEEITSLSVELDALFTSLSQALENLSENKFQQYDAIVSVGELLSTKIISHYLISQGFEAEWVDARELIKTNDAFNEAKIDWPLTQHLMQQSLANKSLSKWPVTQGFIGSTLGGQTVTLGREGSDFSAAVFAYSLNAEEVIIWKDVPGILNADPKKIEDALLIEQMSYEEAGEMTYYGAKVIHPKTMRPLAHKSIPLRVRSFEDTHQPGTLISSKQSTTPYSSIIFNTNQLLISFRQREFSFIDEKTLGLIFHSLDQLNVKINLMQNSATSFSICMDYHQFKLNRLFEVLSDQFEIQYNEGLTLLTLNNYKPDTVGKLISDKELILEQKSRKTAHYVYR
ncbi:MAG: aspartate kinase [Bacteroidota bacterium]